MRWEPPLLLIAVLGAGCGDCPEMYETVAEGDVQDEVDLVIEAEGYDRDQWRLRIMMWLEEGTKDSLYIKVVDPWCTYYSHFWINIRMNSGSTMNVQGHGYSAGADCPQPDGETYQFQDLAAEGDIIYEHSDDTLSIHFDDVRFHDASPTTTGHPQFTSVHLNGDYTAEIRPVGCL